MDKYIAAFFTILLLIPVGIGLWKGLRKIDDWNNVRCLRKRDSDE